MKQRKLSNSRRRFLWTVRGGMYFATALTGLLTLFLVAYVLIQGIPNLSWEFVSTKPSYLSGNIGILPDILNTVYTIVACGVSGLEWARLPDFALEQIRAWAYST